MTILTVKLTSKEADMLAFDTVTVAVYDPRVRPVLGTMVNVLVLPTAVLAIDVFDRVNWFALDNETVKAPVTTLPVLVIVIVLAGCEP